MVRQFASVYHVEERANSEADNPNIQAKYLEVGMQIVEMKSVC